MNNVFKCLSLILCLVGCVDKNFHTEKMVVGNYGHLARMNQYAKTNAYLIYFPPKKLIMFVFQN